jgi:hypothetical protein
MKSRVLFFTICLLFAAACQQHPLTDYRPLGQAGMWSGGIEQLKKLNVSDQEVAQVVKLKQARVSDDTCVALVTAAHASQRSFSSSDSVINLQSAGYGDTDILDFERANKLDSIAGDAVMLRLIGLSSGTVQIILQRHLNGLPTMDTAQISRLKNTGLTEKQILEQINQGMTDEQANREATVREAERNHAHTEFVHVRGRKPQPH